MIANFYTALWCRGTRAAIRPPPNARILPYLKPLRAPSDSLTLYTQHELEHVYSWIFARISESRKRKYSCRHKLHVSKQRNATRKHVLPAHLLAHLDGAPTPARKQHTVASLHAHRLEVAVLVGCPRADSDDGRLREGAVR